MAELSKGAEIMLWQKELREQPRIYWVETWVREDGWYPTGNFYVSESAASQEIAWCERRKRRARLCSGNIYSEDLARRRWVA